MLPFQINSKNLIIEKKINSGSFADIYSAIDFSSSQPLALKIERKNNVVPTIDHEASILKLLQRIPGVPHMLWSGLIHERPAFATNRLGNSLHDYMARLKRFSIETIIKLAVELLKILEEIHRHGILHKDLKPSNILMGIENQKNNVFLIDFNLSKGFLDKDGKHMPLIRLDEFNGNLQFSSINSHEFLENCRKDDLESLGYMLSFFYLGKLSWENIEGKDIVHKIKNFGDAKKYFIKKLNTNPYIPICLKQYFENIMTIGFYDAPNYASLREIFIKFAENEGIHLTKEWEWDVETKPKISLKKQRFCDESLNYMETSEGTGSDKNSMFSNRKSNKKLEECDFGIYFYNLYIND